MQLGIITDTHFGCRKNSRLFHDYFEKFYTDVFFPTIEKKGITHLIHMGDCFDSRKGIDFAALQWSKRVFFDPLRERGIEVHLIVGNHDTYYKNTNEVNAVNLLLEEYDNVKKYSKATEIKVGGLDILLCPWINEQNQKHTADTIQKSSSSVLMGHLELQGFRVNKHVIMDHGHDTNMFSKFERVFSGHYHTRSDDGKIFYLGNPYEMFWTDVQDSRGFILFDTKTLEHEYVNNPHRLFYNIYYEDNDHQLFDVSEYEKKIVKVIVKKKTDTLKFEKFIDKLYTSGVADLKIVENFQMIENEEFETEDTEDTLSILDRYIEESETELDKSIIQSLIREIYQEACELL